MHSFSWYVLSDGSRAKHEVTTEDWLPKPCVGKQSFPELIFLGIIEDKKIDVAQLGKVNSTGSRLLGSAASMTLNKPGLPKKTPNRTTGCGVAWPAGCRNDMEVNVELEYCWVEMKKMSLVVSKSARARDDCCGHQP